MSKIAKPVITKKPIDSGCVQIRGARQNNLRGIDLDLPLGKLNVISGPSGSGKSSLAFDTIYAEGQRRYVETFSPYTRQFLERMDKPKVDEILGIPPAIAIEQSNPVKSSRSTVGTMTEINDYLKVLMPRIAEASCPECSQPVRPETAASILAQIFETLSGRNILVAFGVPVPPKSPDFLAFLQQQGYVRIWLEGQVVRTDAKVARLPGLVQVIQDRVLVVEENRSRLGEAIEAALSLGKGKLTLIEAENGRQLPFSSGWHCAHCDIEITAPTPGLFSFNNPLGACPKCRGFGRTIGVDLERAIPDRSLSLADGAIKPFQSESGKECQRDLAKAAARAEVDLHVPFEELPKADQQWVLLGEDPKASGEELWSQGRWYGVRGFFNWLESKSYKMHVRVLLSRYRSYTTCPDCHGGRFQPATLNFRVAGKTLPELCVQPVAQLLETFGGLKPQDATQEMLLKEVRSRVGYLSQVGLGYLSLDRPTRTLSGGELERVNLTTCLGASLVNTLFVMDEPSVGLHPRDVGRLIEVMRNLRDKGNTLLVVEHEEAVLRAADNLIEIGPGRGSEGGELVFNGPLGALDGQSTLTADYLSGRKSIAMPDKRRRPKGWIKIEGARQHNLQGVDVEVPLGVFGCVTGVSGSGKSTLVHDVLYQNLLRLKGESSDQEAGLCKRITGAHKINEVVMVDQAPLSRTPRSSPAVYLGVFDAIRQLFGTEPQAVAAGLTPGSFSFNSGNGRCERCGGNGFEKIEMQFLSDLYVRCPECDGAKYQPHILKIAHRGKSIHKVLELTVTEAIAFFHEQPKIAEPLHLLERVGLGYLQLGQPLNVLSGGESQRLKLVHHLAGNSGKNNLLIFDEPTTGLHLDDISMLLAVFQQLVEQGNSLLVIEHNLEVIKCADYLIDLGPEAGTGGGLLVGAGTPEELAGVKQSHTGRFLKELLGGKASHDHGVRKGATDEPVPVSTNTIEVHGAREHNLKDISVWLPRGQMVVVTGLSGSGKSTLAFDILFAEGQRRFLDSMSPYARQFVEQLEKPDVDLIAGLPPTVAIEQRVTRGGGKSTVATVTEVYHFLRLMFAKLGTQYCPKCNVPVEKQSLAGIGKKLAALSKQGPVKILAPLVKARKGFHTEVAKWALDHGFSELLVDKMFMPAAGFKKLERFKEHSIDVVVDDLEKGLEIGRGTVRVLDAKKRFTVFSTEMSCPGCGDSFEELDPRLFSFNSPHGWCEHCHGFGEVWNISENQRAESELEKELDEERQHEWLDAGDAAPCPQCHGARLNAVARNVRVDGKGIDELTKLSVRSALQTMGRFKFEGARKEIARDLLAEISQRLGFMGAVGLDYLSLGRSAKTLSGGESQRIRLAAQLGSNLRGVLYVLDEPTIGLHPRDNKALLDTLEALKANGNSLVIVEHDEETMERADYILDLGPGAGIHGGEVVASGTLADIKANPASVTGRCLREGLFEKTKRRSLKSLEHWLELCGASVNNLKNVDVRFPVGRLSVITGISGAGKSTLMRELFQRAKTALAKGARSELGGSEHLEAVYEVDQSPIGKTSRSTPATYIKVFDEIRKQYALTPTARMRGFSASRFSFNNEGGRCETCAGQGVIKVEMNFLPTSFIPCTECSGLRYNSQTLDALYNGKSIGQVMEMSIEEAADFFKANPKIHRPLSLLAETGLGYLKLGQPSPTLSGGEAQRLKLVTELTRGVGRGQAERLRKQRQPKSMLYLLEEPTIGLHMSDVKQLLKVLNRLVDDGATVVVIEHNLTVMAAADYIVDVGPEAGENGGKIVAAGTPEQVARSKSSRTAPFLKAALKGS